jgi:hypothetical protein
VGLQILYHVLRTTNGYEAPMAALPSETKGFNLKFHRELIKAIVLPVPACSTFVVIYLYVKETKQHLNEGLIFLL